MSEYLATISWKRGDDAFVDHRYSRAHDWSFDGGLTVPASASPHSVRPPMSDPSAIDPEEAFVASISSCHMLWFLWGPHVVFGGDSAPTADDLRELHDAAHHECYIATSVRTEIRIEPTFA